MNKPKLDNFKKALSTLSVAMKNPPNSLLERDGIIQRFEYCLEVSWLTAKKVLEFHNVQTDSPRNVFRELAKNGWITNPEIWFEFIEARNKASHIYHDEVAEEVFKVIPLFLLSSQKLLVELEKRLT